MPSKPLQSLRRLWRDIHLWIGVGLLAAMIPLGLSGSLLVWHGAVDRALHPERFAISGEAATRPLSAYAEAAQTAFGARARLTQVRLPQAVGDPVTATGRLDGPPGPGGRPRLLTAWIDPPTGRVLATADISRTFTQWTHRLHGGLLIPEIGRKVVGWLGWALFVSCASGLWLWWPRNGAFLPGLRWRRGASTLFNLHHLVGFWICLPLAALSLTGVYLSFPQTARALFGVAEPARGGAPGGGSGRFAPPISSPALPIDQAAQAALEARPGARLVSISLPVRGPAPAWRVQVTAGDGARPANVLVDDRTGQAKAGRAGDDGPDPLSRWMRQLHDGHDMGLVWRTMITVGGVAPALLGISGLVMWLQRRARRRQARAIAVVEA